MLKIFKFGYVHFETKNVQEVTEYYTNIMGLRLVETGEDGTNYLSNGADHHNVVLSPGKENKLIAVGWQMAPTASMKEFQVYLSEKGIKSTLYEDYKPGIKEFLEVEDPDGRKTHLYKEMEYSTLGFGKEGIVPTKLGHIALCSKDAQKTVQFYHEILGFWKTCWGKNRRANFLTCNYDHHTLNIFQSNKTIMHHLAFELKDASHQYQSSDLLYKHDIEILWGPSRHTAGHNVATYHLSPDNHLIELYIDMDIYIPELNIMEPRPWHNEIPLHPKEWTKTSVWDTEFEYSLHKIAID